MGETQTKNETTQLEGWMNIDEMEFMKFAQPITVNWAWSFKGTGSKFRKRLFGDTESTRAFLSDAFLPWYHNELGSIASKFNKNAVNFSVHDWVRTYGPQVRKIQEPSKAIVIVSAYDTALQKRLFVDGCKRAAAVYEFGLNAIQISSFLVVEAFGENIHRVFSPDFSRLMGVNPSVLRSIWLIARAKIR